MNKLLVLSDSPTVQTGFGRVANNLLKHWRPHFDQIDCWAINYVGQPHKLQHEYRLFPASNIGTGSWATPQNLERFLNLLNTGGYTHVFLLQDTFQLSAFQFPQTFRAVCQERRIRSMLYYPVDAPLEPGWTAIIAAVDVAVAYTNYGVQESRKALHRLLGEEAFRAAIASKALKAETSFEGYLKTVTLKLPDIAVLPHGTDPDAFYPVPDRQTLRSSAIKGIKPDDFLMLNVNANQPRKDMARSLQLLAEMKAQGFNGARLVMHTYNPSPDGVDLELVGEQLGLKLGVDWTHNGHMFKVNWTTVGEDQINTLYNMADLVISSSLGEGWGLSITEALAAGCPVAVPDHTSCAEIADEVNPDYPTARIIKLPVEKYGLVQANDNSRVRPRLSVELAAFAIIEAHKAGFFKERMPMPGPVREWLSWERIASEFLKLMGVEKVSLVPTLSVENVEMAGEGNGTPGEGTQPTTNKEEMEQVSGA